MEPDWAPNHVRNFLMLTATGWYNGTVFHRTAERDFVVQGGTAAGRAGGETHYTPTGLSALSRRNCERRGQARARHRFHGARRRPRLGDDLVFPDAGAAPSLDGQFSAFGRVVEGLDVLDAFAKEEVDGETPKRRLEITEARIDWSQ